MPAEGTGATNQEESAHLIQMRQSLGLLRVAFDATGEAMLIVDSQRHVRWVNQTAAAIWGEGLTLRVVGKRFEDLLHLRQLDQRLLTLSDSRHPLNQARLGEGQASLLVQVMVSSAGGQPDVLQRVVCWRPISEMGGVFTLLIFRDLEPLEKSLQQQRAFINTLAHELRTPLAILIGNLRRLRRKSQAVAPTDRALADALDETRRIASLVDKLLLLSELDTDHIHWKLKPAPLHQFLDDWLHSLVKERRSRVSLEVDDSVSTCWMDLDQIAVSRILDALLENSLLCGSDGISVRVKKSAIPRFVDFVVIDHVSRHRDCARAHSSMHQSSLGMVVVKNLVEGMNGQLIRNEACDQNGDMDSINVLLRFPTAHPGSAGFLGQDAGREDGEDVQIDQV